MQSIADQPVNGVSHCKKVVFAVFS